MPSEREVISKFCTEWNVLILMDYSSFCVENNLYEVEQKQENHSGTMTELTHVPHKFSLSCHILAGHKANRKNYIFQASLQWNVALWQMLADGMWVGRDICNFQVMFLQEGVCYLLLPLPSAGISWTWDSGSWSIYLRQQDGSYMLKNWQYFSRN